MQLLNKDIRKNITVPTVTVVYYLYYSLYIANLYELYAVPYVLSRVGQSPVATVLSGARGILLVLVLLLYEYKLIVLQVPTSLTIISYLRYSDSVQEVLVLVPSSSAIPHVYVYSVLSRVSRRRRVAGPAARGCRLTRTTVNLGPYNNIHDHISNHFIILSVHTTIYIAAIYIAAVKFRCNILYNSCNIVCTDNIIKWFDMWSWISLYGQRFTVVRVRRHPRAGKTTVYART